MQGTVPSVLSVNSFNLHHTSLPQVLLVLFHRCRNWGTGMSRNLPEIMQSVSGWAGIQATDAGSRMDALTTRILLLSLPRSLLSLGFHTIFCLSDSVLKEMQKACSIWVASRSSADRVGCPGEPWMWVLLAQNPWASQMGPPLILKLVNGTWRVV